MSSKTKGKYNAKEKSDDQKESHQKARREALKANALNYQIQGKGYQIDKDAKKSAYAELESLQKSAIADYQNWAKEDIRYDILESDGVAGNLKQRNDVYTMSMMMSVIAPLERGVTISSVLQCMMSYNAIKAINPTMDMDSSRVYYDLKNTIAPLMSDMKKDHPIAYKALYGVFGKPLDISLSSAGGSKMAATIDAHQQLHDIDTMCMTPRQIAALKLNFMEQYYSDLRGTSDEYERKNHTADYNKAMQHLQAICKTSGYDMSVVASEERYLVGMKMMENPDYATMFAETYDIFGAHIDQASIDKSGRMMGQFITTDEHVFYGGKDIQTDGAFHVRMPMSKDDMITSMEDHAKDFNEMREYINSPLFTGTAKAKRDLFEKIKSDENEYLKRMSFIAKTDGVDIDVRSEYSDCMNHAKNSAVRADAFASELDSIVTTKIARQNGYDPDAMRANPRRRLDTESEEYKNMMSGIMEYAGIRRGKEVSPDEQDRIFDNVKAHYYEDLSVDEQYKVLAHAAANIEQGYQQYGSDRDNIREGGVRNVQAVFDELGIDLQYDAPEGMQL